LETKRKSKSRFSLSHIVDEVSKVLGKEVKFASDCIGEVAEKAAAELQAGNSFVRKS
jgi:phosphoglycerate kinase